MFSYDYVGIFTLFQNTPYIQVYFVEDSAHAAAGTYDLGLKPPIDLGYKT